MVWQFLQVENDRQHSGKKRDPCNFAKLSLAIPGFLASCLSVFFVFSVILL